MSTVVCGYIQEMDFWLDPVKSDVSLHNSTVISQLPHGNAWPPLSAEMFAICHDSEKETAPNLEYGGRIIHFGANLKFHIPDDWDEWHAKFEKLLDELYFVKAGVYLMPEWYAPLTATWRVDFNKYKVLHDGSFPAKVSREAWQYESKW